LKKITTLQLYTNYEKKAYYYSLSVEDIQNVANQELGRDLSSNEIEKNKRYNS